MSDPDRVEYRSQDDRLAGRQFCEDQVVSSVYVVGMKSEVGCSVRSASESSASLAAAVVGGRDLSSDQ